MNVSSSKKANQFRGKNILPLKFRGGNPKMLYRGEIHANKAVRTPTSVKVLIFLNNNSTKTIMVIGDFNGWSNRAATRFHDARHGALEWSRPSYIVFYGSQVILPHHEAKPKCVSIF